MSLNFTRLLTYEDIVEEIDKASLDGSCCMRYGGIQAVNAENGDMDIIAWQCNMADVQNFDVKLPTVIRMHINSDKCISSIELMSNFKGSQGMVCSYLYLNKKLQNTLRNEKFEATNPKINNQHILCCRHTYELVYGAVTFVENCMNIEEKNCYYVTEITRAFQKESGLDCFDSIDFNGRLQETKICIRNIIGNIHYNAGGKVDSATGIEISGLAKENDSWALIHDKFVIDATSNNQYVMKIIKAVSTFWMSCGKRLGINSKFYFSQLWGPTFFGIISQGIGLMIFNNNYAYFQHCIYGIQRNAKDEPLCIGVSNNVEETMTFFKDFNIDDL